MGDTLLDTPILYYWAPCTQCAPSVSFAEEHGIAIDKRDVEQQQPYDELLALGGDGNQIPYLYTGTQLIQGSDAINAYLTEQYL